MPELDARKATTIIREYFDEIKKVKFLFDVQNVHFDEDEKRWIVNCQIQNLFEEEPLVYQINVDDETGDIVYVKEI